MDDGPEKPGQWPAKRFRQKALQKVVNRASELMLGLFGEARKHAHCALGASNVPGNIPVEVEMIVELEQIVKAT